jgi:thiosulfate/3-mercaptopyruvate sulfurtransferase
MTASVPHLVQAGELASQLDDPQLRVFDCTVVLAPAPENPFATRSGRHEWAHAHIPGAGFLDLEGELSAPPRPPLRYQLPDPGHFAQVAARAGIGEGTRVVLYCAGHPMWAARVWWMLRLHGFDDVSLLDGGWDNWLREGRPVEQGPSAYPPGDFRLRMRPALLASREDVLHALQAGDRRLVNSLSRKQHAGQGLHYGRAGRIPGSVCQPALELTDRATGRFLPSETLRGLLRPLLEDGGPVITYCGAGIAAACTAFALDMVGAGEVAVYDGSLAEWAGDPALPMETG